MMKLDRCRVIPALNRAFFLLSVALLFMSAEELNAQEIEHGKGAAQDQQSVQKGEDQSSDGSQENEESEPGSSENQTSEEPVPGAPSELQEEVPSQEGGGPLSQEDTMAPEVSADERRGTIETNESRIQGDDSSTDVLGEVQEIIEETIDPKEVVEQGVQSSKKAQDLPAEKETQDQSSDDANENLERPLWADADDMGWAAGQGSIEVCEALTFPLKFVPYIGGAMGTVFEWACLLPGGFSVEYVSLYHGTHNGWLWQSLVALLLSKLWREWTRWPVLIALTALSTVAFVGVGSVLIGAAVALPAWSSAPAYLPVLAAGLMTFGGIGYVLMRKIRKWGQEFIFHTTYRLLTSEIESEEMRMKKKKAVWVKPPFNAAERLWALSAMAAGVDPSSSWQHMVPVVGPAIKAKRRAKALKTKMRTISNDVLLEKKSEEDFELMDQTVDTLCFVEGGLAASAHVALIGGVAIFGAGSLLAAIQFTQGENVWTYAAVTSSVGLVGMGVAGGALGLLLARELVKSLKPFAIPLAYGVIPEAGVFGFFAAEEE